MFSYLCVTMSALLSSCNSEECYTAAVEGSVFFSGWVVGYHERKKCELLELCAHQCQGEYLIIRHRKGLTFTDSFPLCAVSVPHSWGLNVCWMPFAAKIKCLFWCLTVMLIEGQGSNGHERTGCSLWLCANTCSTFLEYFLGLFAWLFKSLCATIWMCVCRRWPASSLLTSPCSQWG